MHSSVKGRTEVPEKLVRWKNKIILEEIRGWGIVWVLLSAYSNPAYNYVFHIYEDYQIVCGKSKKDCEYNSGGIFLRESLLENCMCGC